MVSKNSKSFTDAVLREISVWECAVNGQTMQSVVIGSDNSEIKADMFGVFLAECGCA